MERQDTVWGDATISAGAHFTSRPRRDLPEATWTTRPRRSARAGRRSASPSGCHPVSSHRENKRSTRVNVKPWEQRTVKETRRRGPGRQPGSRRAGHGRHLEEGSRGSPRGRLPGEHHGERAWAQGDRAPRARPSEGPGGTSMPVGRRVKSITGERVWRGEGGARCRPDSSDSARRQTERPRSEECVCPVTSVRWKTGIV